MFPVMTREDAIIVLADLYETRFGIFDHKARDKNPLASVLMHESEDVMFDSALADLLIEFAVDEIGDLWKISLTEYLNLPKPVADLLRRLKPIAAKKKAELLGRMIPNVPGT